MSPSDDRPAESRSPVTRPFTLLLALAVLAAVVVWLSGPSVEVADAGAAVRLVGRPETPVVALLRDASADPPRWVTVDLDAAGPDGALAEGPGVELLGEPCLARDGSLLGVAPADAERPERLALLGRDGGVREVALPAASESGGPSGFELVGLVGPGDQPVVLHGPSRALWWLQGDQWLRVADASVPAAPAAGAPFALSASRAALAFRGDQGWEAWLLDSRPPTRRLARDCMGPVAAFAPDGQALLLDGPMMNIYRLELSDGRLAHTADGNLGHSPRVPWTHGVRGDPPLLVAPAFDLHGYLQLVQTHFSGGGRYQFNTGFEHHYLPTVSPAGRWMAYAQAPFDAEGSGAFEEQLYLFDFDNGTTPAVALGSRLGGVPGRGPAWVRHADGLALLWVADGRLRRLDLAE